MHGGFLAVADGAAGAAFAAMAVAGAVGLFGLLNGSSQAIRGHVLVACIAGVAWSTGGIHSSITLWLAVAALVYPAILPRAGAFLAWGALWYLPLVAAGGSIGEAVIRTVLVSGGGAVAWGLGATTSHLTVEKERTELALRDAQGRFAAAFEHASSGMIMFGPDGTIFRANQAMADFLGLTMRDLHASRFADLFHPGDQEVIAAKIGDLTAGVIWSFQDELRCVHESDRVIWALVGIGLITSAEGAPAYFFAHFQDISSRVATEASLRANEEHYRTLFGRSPIPIWEVDYTAVEELLLGIEGPADIRAFLRVRRDLLGEALRQVKVRDANDAARDLIEAPEQSGYEADLPLLVPNDRSADALVEQLAAVFEGADRVQGSISTRTPSGAAIDGILHWAAPVVNGERDLSRVVLAFADFSETRKARIALQRIEERLRAVVSASPILLFALDAQGVFTLSEGQALQALRLSPGEAVGRSAFELFRDSPELVAAVRRALSGDSLTTSADIRGRVLDVRLGPMWEAGSVTGVIGVGNDVTERTRATEQLEQLVRSKDQFVASVSHELRTPLTAVVGFAEELNHGIARFDRDEAATLVALIAQQAIEVADLVEDLLVAARSELDTVSVHSETVDLWQQVELVLLAMPPQEAEHIELIGDPTKVFADPIRLRQVLRNLITNARRYGGNEMIVSVETTADLVTVEVRDNGDGIPVRERAKIFDPYFRGDKGNASGSSVGLGLTVSHQLAERMDGDLVYLYEDGWSVFRLSLPAG